MPWNAYYSSHLLSVPLELLIRYYNCKSLLEGLVVNVQKHFISQIRREYSCTRLVENSEF